MSCPNLLFERVDKFQIYLVLVRPPFSNVAAIPDDAAEMHLFPCPLAYANIAFIRRACSPYGAL